MPESKANNFLFAPLEKSLENVVEKKPSKFENSMVRIETALKKLLKLRDSDFIERKRKREEVEGKVDLDKSLVNKLEIPSAAVELPTKITTDAREDFKKTFPKWAAEIERTPVKYMVGYNKLTDDDKKNFFELLTEKGTLMGEAYPFYELLTQKLSEKAASSHKGAWGKIFGFMAKATGWMSYRLDMPVAREWNNVESHLTAVYGKERTTELIEDLYFGDKDEYQGFLQACEMAKLDFVGMSERAKTHSWYTNTLYKRIIENPKILNNPLVVGGLNLPGKIHDVSTLMITATTLGVGSAIATAGALINTAPLDYLMTNLALGGLAGIAAVGIGMGGIGIMFHELTHIYGGNFRRKLREIGEKK